MAFNLFKTIKTLALISLVANVSSYQLREQTCQDITIDKCFYDDDGLIETLKDVDEASCQFYCNVIYSGQCNFFIYDHKQVICELLQEPFGNYVDSCKKIGGPPSPSVDSCQDSNDPCKDFLEGYCRYEGDLLEHLERLVPLSECQEACVHLPGCEYFVYDIDTEDCELLAAPTRKCDILRGPPTPSNEECQRDGSTTNNPITTTTSKSTQTTTSSKSTAKSTTHITTPTMYTTTKPTPPPSNYRLMIVGGVDGQGNRLDDVEMIDPTQADSNCVKPKSFPYNVIEMVSETYNGNSLVCGGLRDNNQPTSECYQYTQDQWTGGPDRLTLFRYRSSSVRLNDGRIWILGGDGKNGESTTSEILNKNGQFEIGPALPEPMQSHCTAVINSTHVFFAGNGYDPQTQAYIVDTSREPFHFYELPSMRSKRFGAACSVVVDPAHPMDYRYTKLLVAGGDPPGYVSSEMYSFMDNNWTYGPALDRGFEFGGYINYPDQFNSFVLIGGKDGSNNYHTDMMWYNYPKNSFEYLPAKITTARGDFGVALHLSDDDC